MARERCSAVVLSDRWSVLLGEKVGARSVMLPKIYIQELPVIYSQEESGATRVFEGHDALHNMTARYLALWDQRGCRRAVIATILEVKQRG